MNAWKQLRRRMANRVARKERERQEFLALLDRFEAHLVGVGERAASFGLSLEQANNAFRNVADAMGHLDLEEMFHVPPTCHSRATFGALSGPTQDHVLHRPPAKTRKG